jgi:hypothetical protein
MELVINKIFNTIYIKNNSLTLKEKTFAISLTITPFLVVALWLLRENIF